MHSAIFQISTKPIEEENLLRSEKLYEETYSFCDYIGGEYSEKDRIDAIKYLQEDFKDIFDLEEDHLIYKGIGSFIDDWNTYMKDIADKLDNGILHWQTMYRIKRGTEETHVECGFRFFIHYWNGWPGPASDLIEFVNHSLKPGDKLYIGSVIDYHY